MGENRSGKDERLARLQAADPEPESPQSAFEREHDAFADDEEDLSLEDEDLVRTAFAAALAEAIGDKGLVDAPGRSRQDRAQLVEVMQTQLHGKEIEELHFIAMSFGLAATIELDPMMPEGHEGRVMVSIANTGRSYV